MNITLEQLHELEVETHKYREYRWAMQALLVETGIPKKVKRKVSKRNRKKKR